MENTGTFMSRFGVTEQGLRGAATVYWNLPTPMLYEHVVRRREGAIAHLGPLVVRTGDHTGRSPRDKFIVRESATTDQIRWGPDNAPMEPERFQALFRRVRAYVQNREIYVLDCYAGADPRYRLPVRVVTETAWHNLFARNMFVLEPDGEKLQNFRPEYTVVHMPGFRADPELDGTNSQTFIALGLGEKLVLVGGTAYAGEIKKSIFTVMNYLLPRRDVLTMHCSANYGRDRNDVALFFGLSATGKTTLSSDPERTLIGDDEHGWSDRGVFNIEGGCYAKVIHLDAAEEPEIHAASRKFGAILENVGFNNKTRRVDLDDDSLTENTRVSYPVNHLARADSEGMGGHPRNIVFLTADAFGVLPPISRLTPAQAQYYFISGYTAKVAGTEQGVTEPRAVFSPCFGAPFMPLSPAVYADLLGRRIRDHGVHIWLVNTGWTGGPYGEGHRIALRHTRRMVAEALSGGLDQADTRTDDAFGLDVPRRVEGVPDEVLTPRATWSDPARYDERAAKLRQMFADNFEQFAGDVTDEVRAAGPVR